MDPLTSFVTIVGLLASFQSGRDGKKDLESFKQWLSANNHDNMISIINSNRELQQGLMLFMNQNHEQVMSQLFTINDLLTKVSSNIEGLGLVAASLDAKNGLSDQAIDVLRQFVNSGGAEMLRSRTIGGHKPVHYTLVNGDTDYEEIRFIEADIDSLVEAKLITLTHSRNNTAIYKITRQAVTFINQIDFE